MTDVMPCGHSRSAVVSSDDGTHYCAGCEEEARLREKARCLERELSMLRSKVRQLTTRAQIEQDRHRHEAKLTNCYIYALHVAEHRIERIAGMECTCGATGECPVCVARDYRYDEMWEPEAPVCIVDCPCCNAALQISRAKESGEFFINAEERP